MSGPSQAHWLTRPTTIRRLWRAGLAGLAALGLLDLVVVADGHFGVDGSFGFYSWYGLLTCMAMVVFAKAVGFFLQRTDTYYDDR